MTSCSPTSTTTATSMWPAPQSREVRGLCAQRRRRRLRPRRHPAGLSLGIVLSHGRRRRPRPRRQEPISWRGASDDLLDWWLSDHTPPSGTMVLDGGGTWSRDLTVSVESNVSDATELRTRDGGGMWGVWQPYSAAAAHTMAAGDVASRSVQVQYRDAGENVLALSDTIGVDTVAAVGGATTCSPGWQHGPVVVTIDRERRDERRRVHPLRDRGGPRGRGRRRRRFDRLPCREARRRARTSSSSTTGPWTRPATSGLADPGRIDVDAIPPRTTDKADHENPYVGDCTVRATGDGRRLRCRRHAGSTGSTRPSRGSATAGSVAEEGIVTIPFLSGDNTGVVRFWYFSVDRVGNIEAVHTDTVRMGEIRELETAGDGCAAAASARRSLGERVRRAGGARAVQRRRQLRRETLIIAGAATCAGGSAGQRKSCRGHSS